MLMTGVSSHESKTVRMIKKNVLGSYKSSCNKCTKLDAHWGLHKFCIHLAQLIAEAITGQFLIQESTHCSLTPSYREIYSIELLGGGKACSESERVEGGGSRNKLGAANHFIHSLQVKRPSLFASVKSG